MDNREDIDRDSNDDPKSSRYEPEMGSYGLVKAKKRYEKGLLPAVSKTSL